MKKDKWLLRKISGSRARYINKPDYSEERASKKVKLHEAELAPTREKMSAGKHHLDTTLVRRWLFSQVGQHFDIVYSKFLERIQPKYRDDYKIAIFYYVARNIYFDGDDNIWGWYHHSCPLPIVIKGRVLSDFRPFYINPQTNKLHLLSDFESEKNIKKLDKTELRLTREKEKQQKLQRKRDKQDLTQQEQYIAALREHSRTKK